MKQNWRVALLGLSVAAATGCIADVDGEGVDDENVASVEQAEVLACPVSIASQVPSIRFNQELLIKDITVVNDSCRTSWENTTCTTTSRNKWHFWHLMTQMAGTNNVTRFVLRWLESIENWPHLVNNQMLSSRPLIRNSIINPWMDKTNKAKGNEDCKLSTSIDDPLNANCQLNSAFAPFRLLAIVNRMDLRSAGAVNPYGGGGSAGEGRIVFGFLDPLGNPIQGTVIFEYNLPTNSSTDKWTPLKWAQKWHSLGGTTVFGASYNTALQEITDKFASAGANPGGFNNGSSINQIRVNERNFVADTDSSPAIDTREWSLREFKLGCLPGTICGTNDKYIIPAPVNQTPANGFNRTATLDDYLNQNTGTYGPNGTGVLGEAHNIPATFNNVAFKGAESKSHPLIGSPGVFIWSNLNPLSNQNTETDVRRQFALSTCNGCHYFETQTNFLHIINRSAASASELSSFLSTDPNNVFGLQMPYQDATGVDVAFNEPRRRVCELLWLLGGNSTLLSNTSGRGH